MKYSIIFAATAAAYDAYGAGNHGDSHSTTKVDYPTAATPTGYEKSALKTYTVGYGKPDVTITTQHQPYQTCGGSKDGKNCDKWNDDVYVSTVIKDCDDKDVTVTKKEQVITIYRTKTTVTNYATATPTAFKKDDYLSEDCTKDARYVNADYSNSDYKHACDKSIVYKNYDANCKTNSKYSSADYKHDCDKSIEYKSWNESKSNDKKEWHALYERSEEASYVDLGPHALKGYPGSGLRKDLNDKQPVYVREYKDGKWNEFKDERKYGTPEEVKTYEKPGVYTNPAKDVYVDYPITMSHDKVYQPGVYHYAAETITITKPNQAYTCEYTQTKTYDGPKETGSYNGNKDGEKYCNGSDCKDHATVGTPAAHYPASTPSVNTKTYPHGGDYEHNKSSSTSCTSSTQTVKTDYHGYPTTTPSHNNGSYDDKKNNNDNASYDDKKDGDKESYDDKKDGNKESYDDKKDNDKDSHDDKKDNDKHEYANEHDGKVEYPGKAEYPSNNNSTIEYPKKDDDKVDHPEVPEESDSDSDSDSEEEYKGDEHTGDEHTGDEHTGDEHTGDEHTGDEHTGDEHTGDEHTGDEHTGDEHTGDEHTGDENTDADLPVPSDGEDIEIVLPVVVVNPVDVDPTDVFDPVPTDDEDNDFLEGGEFNGALKAREFTGSVSMRARRAI